MKVAFFNTKAYEKKAFEETKNANKEKYEAIKINYLSELLTVNSVHLAANHEAICIFVNDTCDKPVIE